MGIIKAAKLYSDDLNIDTIKKLHSEVPLWKI